LWVLLLLLLLFGSLHRVTATAYDLLTPFSVTTISTTMY
jgi:uncharacterized membrane protein YeiB